MHRHTRSRSGLHRRPGPAVVTRTQTRQDILSVLKMYRIEILTELHRLDPAAERMASLRSSQGYLNEILESLEVQS